jgi:CheY-like chemotaxis protein
MNATTLLLADADSEERFAYAAALRRAGHTVYTAATFAEARATLLRTSPDVLVTQVRLADFNGIHLALWGHRQLPNLRCVLIGASDLPLEADARASGFFYVRFNDEQTVLQATTEAIIRDRPRRNWRRKRLTSKLAAWIDDHAAFVLEVGYGGFCAQLPATFEAKADTPVTLDIPAVALRAQATCRWVTAADISGASWCGASLGDDEVRAGSRWRRLVDTLPSQP